MTSDVQPGDGTIDPPRDLLAAARRHAPGWLSRSVVAAAARGGLDLDADDPELATVVDQSIAGLLDELAVLLATDVDEQRTNPLSLFRGCVGPPTELLLRRGAVPVAGDQFAADRFPDDVFGLGPATWADVDPDLHEPGIAWGAWKAMTVLRRRRDDGLR